MAKAPAAVLAWLQDLAVQHAVTGARLYLVLECELDPAAGRLLARAQAAATTVIGSSLHAEDLLDRQRRDTVVPAEVWAIAQAVHGNARLGARCPGPVQDRAARSSGPGGCSGGEPGRGARWIRAGSAAGRGRIPARPAARGHAFHAGLHGARLPEEAMTTSPPLAPPTAS